MPGMNAPQPIGDPVSLVDSLDPDDILKKLDELDAQQRALLSLLRVARKRRAATGKKRRGGGHE